MKMYIDRPVCVLIMIDIGYDEFVTALFFVWIFTRASWLPAAVVIRFC